jgi:hypothetical protein
MNKRLEVYVNIELYSTVTLTVFGSMPRTLLSVIDFGWLFDQTPIERPQRRTSKLKIRVTFFLKN